MKNKINDNQELYAITLEYRIGEKDDVDTWFVRASDYKKVEKYIENKVEKEFRIASIDLKRVSYRKVDTIVDLG